MDTRNSLAQFVEYTKQLKGDEKGEAHIFCDRFFRAFGHGGIIEANGALEARIKYSESGRTKFADCLWSPKGTDGILIEMKKRSTKNLDSHFSQAKSYWIEMNPEVAIGKGAQKPKYIILCNFDRFIIYNNLSLVDDISINDLVDRASAFNFMLPNAKEPIFHNNVEKISEDAAKTIGQIFQYLTKDLRVDGEVAQRFLLQCVLSLFSEDFGLLPQAIFTELIRDCREGASSYDLFGGLFRQMASSQQARGGRFKDVRYFNGGLFDTVDPIDLDKRSLELLAQASDFNWKYVNPIIFGSLFESTMDGSERHQFGAHFTHEADILKIVSPTIIKPWQEKIEKANKLHELSSLLDDLEKFRVLDPACGCGNFLYVAYRALKDIEMQIVEKIAANFSRQTASSVKFGVSRVTTKQFFGIDALPVAVDVARVTMMLGKELAANEWNKRIEPLTATLGLTIDQGLPLDRLDENIICDDSLFCDWPDFDVVIGNPPYQSKNKMAMEMDRSYIDRVRRKYNDVPGRADYCVYWFRRAHDELQEGQRAGLVGTNTIRQNYSREGGLDYIVNNGGTITEAVSTQVWSGDAAVHVSIVNWIKGTVGGSRRLAIQRGDSIDSPFEYYELPKINSALSTVADLTSAKPLRANVSSGCCYQGQTHGHAGFLVAAKEARQLLLENESYSEVLRPFMTAEELIGNIGSQPKRYVINFSAHDVFAAKSYAGLYDVLRRVVYPAREIKAKEEYKKNKETLSNSPKAKVNHHHTNFFKNWWQLAYARGDLMEKLSELPRYIACGRVTKRPIFEFISTEINPNDALQVFPLADDYSFGILQSVVHWEWFTARCSTLKGDHRYTSNSVFDSFPWPQQPTKKQIEIVAKRSEELRKARLSVMQKQNWSLRDLYRVMEETPENLVSKAQDSLDAAVFAAYGIKKGDDILSFLLALNNKLAEAENAKQEIVGPGLPKSVEPESFITSDCVKMR